MIDPPFFNGTGMDLSSNVETIFGLPLYELSISLQLWIKEILNSYSGRPNMVSTLEERFIPVPLKNGGSITNFKRQSPPYE